MLNIQYPLSPTWGSGDLNRIVLVSKDDLWMSPGLIAACEATRLINPDETLQEKTDKLKMLVYNLLEGKDKDQSLLYIPGRGAQTIIIETFQCD